jgi:hypothetical protein
MPVQVIDRNGRVIEVEDDQPVPPGCRLHVPARFMDSQTREVLDNLKQRYPSKAAAEDDEDDADEIDDDHQDGDDDHRDDDPDAIRADAYYAFRQRIDTANINRRKAPKAPKPSDPSWQRPRPWRPRGRFGNDALNEAEGRRAAAYVDFKLKIDTANINRRHMAAKAPSLPPSDAGRLAQIERLQRAFARR